MSGLDFVVHRVLYGYGLRFSYDWAIVYWVLYGCVFFVFSVAVGFIYWLASDRSRMDVKVGFGLFLSLFLFSLGGLQDVFGLFFGVVVCLGMVLFGGGCLGLGCLVFGIVVCNCAC